LPKYKIRNPLKYSELFCGPGGMSLGAKLASSKHPKINIEHLWATDSDENACRTYAHNLFGSEIHKSVIHSKVEKLDYSKLDKPDILSFGFPCNDFSLVGEHKGTDGKYGPLYTYGVKGLNEFSPLAFVAENVSGIKSSNKGDAFGLILDELENAGPGYNLTVDEFKFENYGIPQRRHRMVIVGLIKDLGLVFEPPAESHKGNHVSCEFAIEDTKIKKEAFNNEPTNNTDNVVERLSLIPEGKNIWDVQDKDDFPERLRLNVKKARLSQIYKRLDRKLPAYTVTGSGGGGTHVYHWSKNRALTNRERARLQTFPDDWRFFGGKGDVRKQIGMAVPVLGSEVVFTALLNTLSGIPYETKTPSYDLPVSL
jgi:DNA (cytosine-5)-methyltransferase 1